MGKFKLNIPDISESVETVYDGDANPIVHNLAYQVLEKFINHLKNAMSGIGLTYKDYRITQDNRDAISALINFEYGGNYGFSVSIMLPTWYTDTAGNIVIGISHDAEEANVTFSTSFTTFYHNHTVSTYDKTVDGQTITIACVNYTISNMSITGYTNGNIYLFTSYKIDGNTDYRIILNTSSGYIGYLYDAGGNSQVIAKIIDSVNTELTGDIYHSLFDNCQGILDSELIPLADVYITQDNKIYINKLLPGFKQTCNGVVTLGGMYKIDGKNYICVNRRLLMEC